MDYLYLWFTLPVPPPLPQSVPNSPRLHTLYLSLWCSLSLSSPPCLSPPVLLSCPPSISLPCLTFPLPFSRLHFPRLSPSVLPSLSPFPRFHSVSAPSVSCSLSFSVSPCLPLCFIPHPSVSFALCFTLPVSLLLPGLSAHFSLCFTLPQPDFCRSLPRFTVPMFHFLYVSPPVSPHLSLFQCLSPSISISLPLCPLYVSSLFHSVLLSLSLSTDFNLHLPSSPSVSLHIALPPHMALHLFHTSVSLSMSHFLLPHCPYAFPLAPSPSPDACVDLCRFLSLSVTSQYDLTVPHGPLLFYLYTLSFLEALPSLQHTRCQYHHHHRCLYLASCIAMLASPHCSHIRGCVHIVLCMMKEIHMASFFTNIY